MSQSDELRQAAELLEFWFNMEADNETARDEEDRDPEYTKVIKAALTVSKFMRKHLAEHPADDDEAIDEAGFRSMGATTLAVGLGVRTSVGNICVILNEDSQIYIVQEDEDTFIDEMVSLPQIRTFPQLRRLLAALGAK